MDELGIPWGKAAKFICVPCLSQEICVFCPGKTILDGLGGSLSAYPCFHEKYGATYLRTLVFPEKYGPAYLRTLVFFPKEKHAYLRIFVCPEK